MGMGLMTVIHENFISDGKQDTAILAMAITFGLLMFFGMLLLFRLTRRIRLLEKQQQRVRDFVGNNFSTVGSDGLKVELSTLDKRLRL